MWQQLEMAHDSRMSSEDNQKKAKLAVGERRSEIVRSDRWWWSKLAKKGGQSLEIVDDDQTNSKEIKERPMKLAVGG